MNRLITESKIWLFFVALSILTICNAFWYWILYYSGLLLAYWLIGDVLTALWFIPLFWYGLFGMILLIPTETVIGYRNVTGWLNRAYKNKDTILEVKFNDKTIFKL